MPLTLADIWTVGVWTQPVVGGLYQSRMDGDSLAAAVPADEAAVDPVLLAMSALPFELRVMIIELCWESPVWKLLSAMHRRRKFSSLVDGAQDVVTSIPCPKIRGSWDRDAGWAVPREETGQVNEHGFRLHLDSLGVRRLESMGEGSTPTTSRGDIYYVVEDSTSLAESSIEIEVSRSILAVTARLTWTRGTFFASSPQRPSRYGTRLNRLENP